MKKQLDIALKSGVAQVDASPSEIPASAASAAPVSPDVEEDSPEALAATLSDKVRGWPAVQQFIGQAEDQLVALDQYVASAFSTFKDLVLYFGENPQMTPEAFFTTFVQFVQVSVSGALNALIFKLSSHPTFCLALRQGTC